MNPEAQSLTSYQQIIEAANAPRRFEFELNKKTFFVMLRPLNGAESTELERITDRVPVPIKDGLPNKEDAKYQDAINEAWDQRRAATLDMALLDLKLEGSDLKAKARFLREKLPPGVPHQLFMQVLEITTNPIQEGVFTTSADSQNIPS